MVDQITMDVAAQGMGRADPVDPEESVQSFITGWLSKIDGAKKHHKKDFDKIDESILLSNGIHWPGQTQKDERYIADIIKRTIQRRVAALYAKNPTVVARRTKRLDFQLWDGNQKSLQAAMQNPEDPYNYQLLMDISQGVSQRSMLDKLGKTMEIMFKQQLKQQQPKFKRQMKQLIRRIETTGVGFLRLDYHREMEVKPHVQQNINDLASQLSNLEAMVAEYEEEGYAGDQDARIEEIKIQLQTIEQQKYALVREGLLFSFPRTKALVIDPNCYQMDGFLGARWMAEEFYMPPGEIQRVYKKDIKDGALYVQEKPGNSSIKRDSFDEMNAWKPADEKAANGHYCVYQVYDLDTSSTFTIARGYNGYLAEPQAPKLLIERFFPYYSLSFNDTENPDSIYPDSTAWCLRHPQREFNRAKEALRQHRIASKPLYVSGVGALSDEDKMSIDQHEAHANIELQTLQENQDASSKFQMVKKYPIDPNVYSTSETLKDFFMVAGSQPADLSQVSGATATETSLAEDSRVSDLASNADDLDDFLNDVVEDAGRVMLTEFSSETVKRIAGPGAVWPEFSAQDIVDDIYLEIQAGSSGRPNKAAEAAAIRGNMPFIIQMPGANPEFWLKKLTENTFDNINLEDAYTHGLPSMLSMNAMSQVSTGDPATDPNAQGAEGARNSPAQRAEPVRGLGVGGLPDSRMPQGTAVGGNPEAQGGMMSRVKSLFSR